MANEDPNLGEGLLECHVKFRPCDSLDAVHFVIQSGILTASEKISENSRTRFSAIALWLCAFFSPTAFFLLLILANRFHFSAPPEMLVVSLFFLIPIVALVVCEYVVWMSNRGVARRIGWMSFTLIAMLLQFGVLLVIIVAGISAAISYAQ